MAETNILALSLQEYKKQIDELRNSLLGLERDSEEYQKTAQQCRDMQEKLNAVIMDSKKDTYALEGSYKALSQEMARLKKEWKATNDEATRNALGQQINSINTQLKELDASVGTFTRQVGQYEIAGQSMKSALREQEEELARLIVQGYSPASAEVQALVKQTGALKDAMQTAKALTGQYSDDLQGLSTALDITKTAAAGYGVWQGALAMFGMENEKVAESIKKLQAAQTMLNSLQQFSKALVDEQSATYRIWNTIVQAFTGNKQKEAVAIQVADKAKKAETTTTKALSVAEGVASTESKGLAGAQTAVATATNTASTAMKVLRVALAGLGIGAIVAGISLLVEKLGVFNNQAKESKEGVEDFTSGMADAITQADLLSMSLDDVIRKMLMTEALKQSEEALKGYLKTMAESARKSRQLSKDIEKADKEAANATNTTTTATIQGTLPMQVNVQDNAKDRAEQRARDLRKERSDANKAYNAAMHEYNDELEVLKVVNDGLTALTESYKDNTTEKNKNVNVTKEESKELDHTEEELKDINKQLIRSIQHRKELRKAQGVNNKEMDLFDDLDSLQLEGERLTGLANYYKRISEDSQKSYKERTDAAKKYQETKDALDENNNKREITRAQITTNALKTEYEKRKDAFSRSLVEQDKYISLVLENVEYRTKQIQNSSLPIIEFFNGELRELNFKGLEERSKDLAEKLWDDLDNVLEKDSDKIGIDLGLKSQAPEDLAEIRKYYQDIIDSTEAFTYEQNKEKVKAQEAIRLIDASIATDYFYEQKDALERIMSTLSDQRAQWLNEMAGMDENSDAYKSREAEVQKINDQIANIETERARLVADYIIEQQKRVNENAKESAKERVKYTEAHVNAALDAADAIGSLMSTISDGRKENIERLLDEGKITEEEYKRRFDQIKKMELATLWISTLAGATGAFLQDKKAYPAPWSYIIGGIDFATTFAAGVAQHKSIAAQTYDSASKGQGGQKTAVSVSPLLNEQLDMSTLSTLNTEEIANNTNQKDTRVYIVQQDLEDSAKQVEVRQENTSF